MKTTIRIFAAAAMLAAASTPAFAQGGGGGGGGRGGMNMQAQREMLFEGITLTDAQKVQIDTIFAGVQKKQADLRAEMQGGGDRQAMMGKMQEIQAKRDEDIKKVLTKEQVEQYDKNVAAMRERMQRGRGGSR